MLININGEIPKEFFVFVDFSNQISANNYKAGAYTSAACSTWGNKETLKKYIDGTLTYLPFLLANRDVNAISPYCLTAINEYRVEYDA